jgi:hypothetical protein
MTSWIHLDPAIRDYVLIPIFVVVVLTSVLRSNLTLILGAGKPPQKAPELGELKFLTMFQRLSNLKRNGNFISNFAAKKALYLNSNERKGPLGLLNQEPPQQLSAMEKMMQQNQDPSTALNMVKSQFMFLGVHGSLGYWVSHLFSGFLVAKTPFPLTFKIKSMLQRGVDVAALDTSYVSSLSWYFFIMISSSGLIQLFSYLFAGVDDSGIAAADDSSEMMMMASGGMMNGSNPMGGGGVDIKKQMESERDSLQVFSHEFSLEDAEFRLCEKWMSETPQE